MCSLRVVCQWRSTVSTRYSVLYWPHLPEGFHVRRWRAVCRQAAGRRRVSWQRPMWDGVLWHGVVWRRAGSLRSMCQPVTLSIAVSSYCSSWTLDTAWPLTHSRSEWTTVNVTSVINKDSTLTVKAKVTTVKETYKDWRSNMTITKPEFANCTTNVYITASNL